MSAPLAARAALCRLPMAAASHGSSRPRRRSLAPFVATPPDVVDRMLTLAKVGPERRRLRPGLRRRPHRHRRRAEVRRPRRRRRHRPGAHRRGGGEREAGRRRAAGARSELQDALSRCLRRDGRDALPALGPQREAPADPHRASFAPAPASSRTASRWATGSPTSWTPSRDADGRRAGRCICGQLTEGTAIGRPAS